MAASYSPALRCSTIGETQLEVKILPQVVTRIMGVDPLIGMATGSMPMTGGHGTVAGFVSVLEGMGLKGAGTVGMAAATFGLLVSWLLAKTGITFPSYFGALILAALARNIIGFVRYKEDGGENQSSGQWVKGDTLFDMDRIISVGNICLSMFLGIAMISLKLWELHTLALPLIVILVSQVLMMALFVYRVAFPLLGRDYDAAVLADLINTAVITLFLNMI